jgi:hypothetical protein
MKNSLLFLSLLALAGPAAAQHTELIGRAGLGLAKFGGPSATTTSHVNYEDLAGHQTGYTNNPYGAEWGTGFGLGGRVQRVSRSGLLLAFDLGYDWSRSRTTITTVDLYDGIANTPRPADGTAYLHSQSLTGFVALGYQLRLAAARLDILAGPELAYVSEVNERGNGTYDGGRVWSTAMSRSSAGAPSPDMRLRAEATVWYQRLGFNTSYSYGLLTYERNMIGGRAPKVYARTLRLGLAYRLL